MKRWKLVVIALSAALPAQAANDPVSEDPRVQNALNLISVWLDAERAYDDIPALSAAVVYDQELLWADGFGEANREAGVQATSETIYSICSISKLFTSVAVMQLRDAGKLRLDDRVADHLPWFDIQETFPDAPRSRSRAS